MPRNGPPFLSNDQIQTIVDWVLAGAPALVATPRLTEFIAQINDFIGYDNWQAVDYSIGSTNVALGSAHQGDNDAFSRRVFANSVALESNNTEYELGAILVKETVTHQSGEKIFAQGTGLLGMVKRGGNFNPDHNSWEWFVLSSDLSTIPDRGADVMDGMSNLCHQQADLESSAGLGGEDYVFAHPSEFIAQADEFMGNRSWKLINQRTDTNPLLDNMAHGANLESSLRRVLKKQQFANPDTIEQGHPIGTTIVKK